MKTIISKQFRLQGRDVARGALIAALTSVLTLVLDTVQAGSLTFDWKLIGTTGLTAGVSYLLKNWLEPTRVVNVITGVQAEGIAQAEEAKQ